MSTEYPYSVSGYQFNTDSGIGLIHPDSLQVVPQNLSQVPSQTMQNPVTRLKVEDALSYLDRVKQQFSSNPSIYNEFLDIMKKFKAQSIDTPGVINQVSMLFNGHPELMIGFNAFLPLGFKVPGSKSEGATYVPDQKLSTTGMSAFEPQHARQSPRVLSDSMMDATIGSGGESGRLGGAVSGSQPVEFNHAINYVNKIKLRYQNKPEVYKTFLDILHLYQNEQKQLKDTGRPCLVGMKTVSETDVFNQVSMLFKDDPDLLSEFSHFLPDAGGNSSLMAGMNFAAPSAATLGDSENLLSLCGSAVVRKNSTSTPVAVKPSSATMKPSSRRRLSSSGSSAPLPARRFKSDSGREIMSDYCNLLDFALFDKIHKALGDADYCKFLKVLNLYSIPELHMSMAELLQLIQPFTAAMPEIKKLIRDMLKQKDDAQEVASVLSQNKEKAAVDLNLAFDYASCKVVGQSYRTLPRDQGQATCSGRTELCRQVLNDVYVSCPSWSEDSSSVIKKLGAEEQIFRCEEDRFQVDIVITNFEAVIHELTFINKKLSGMAEEEITKRYTESLFASFSESLLRIVIRRLYASEASQVLEAMKKNPLVVIPIVLTRLEAKADEWRKAKERNSKTWNELNQKYYLKSLDHQGVNFKQTDTKQLRSKALIQELTNVYDERVSKMLPLSPNMELVYQGERCINDATSLIIHHVKRQTSIHQDEKQKIKQLLKHFIPDLFFLPRSELSDDELNDGVDNNGSQPNDQKAETVAEVLERKDSECRKPVHAPPVHSDENATSLLFGNHYWYVFVRLYLILCDRLQQFYEHSETAIQENQRERKKAETSVAVSLGYRAPPLVEPEKCYGYFIEMVKNYLDGNTETVVYEEQLRDLFTINAYVAYTMDKLIQAIVRQLQYLVADTVSVQLMELCWAEKTSEFSHRMNLRMTESTYQHRAEQLLPGENFYRISVLKKSHQVTIDHIPMKNEGAAETGSRPGSSWNQYMEHFVTGDEPVSADCLRHMRKFPVFVRRQLQRNKSKKSPSEIESILKFNVDCTLGIVETSFCQFSVDSIKMPYELKSNSFIYRSTPLLSVDQKKQRLDAVRQKRVDNLISVLKHKQTTPSDRNWFVCAGKRDAIIPFLHNSFCSNCHN